MATSYTGPQANRLYCTECGSAFASDDLVRFGTSLVCANCKPRLLQQLKEGALPASGVEYGGFWRRFVAILIDGIIIAIFTFPITLLLGQRAIIPHQNQPPTISFGYIGASYLISLLANCAYFTYFVSQKGATPGKMLLNLKVVTANGDRLTVARSAGRFFAYILSGLIFCIGYIMAGFDSQKRALHDYICSTRVIKA
jgi:uncharacterized RDD family membrane protein YckC